MRGGAAAARVTHNHEVVGSSPTPATKPTDQSRLSPCNLLELFLLLQLSDSGLSEVLS